MTASRATDYIYIQPKVTKETNADGDVTKPLTRLYLFIDFSNVSRNLLSLTASTLYLTGKTIVGLSAASIAFSIVVGALYIPTGINGFKDSLKAFNESKKELDSYTGAEESTVLLESADNPKDLATLKTKHLIAKLGLANWGLFIGLGATQLAWGIVSLLGPESAHALHYTAILTFNVAKTALLALLTGIGVVYIVRGGVMLYRAQTSINLHTKIRNSLETDFKDKESLIAFLETNCAIKDGVDIYTQITEAQIKQFSEDQINQYLQQLDEGLHNEIMKHKVARDIGLAMILGGVLTLVAAILTHGTSVIAISIASSIIFTAMEITFLRYDSTDHFQIYAHKTYIQAHWLAKDNQRKIYGLTSDQFTTYQNKLKMFTFDRWFSSESWKPINCWNRLVNPLTIHRNQLNSLSIE